MTAVPLAAEHHLGPLSQIPVGEGRVFEVPGGSPQSVVLAVFHLRSGAVHATQAACPHRNGPLADGLVGGTTVICPLHARKFDLATGAALSGECGLVTFPVRITEAGEIVVSVDDRGRADAQTAALVRRGDHRVVELHGRPP